MIIRLTALAATATLTLQASEPETAPPPSPRLVEAVGQLGLPELPNLVLSGYEVDGTTPRRVRRSIDEKRPPAQGEDAGHDAITHWSFRTRWRGGADGRCDPGTATVTLGLTITLPDLTTREWLSRDEKAGWDAYFAALVKHEWNHGRIAVVGRDRIEAAMRAAADCDSMAAAGRAATAEVYATSRQYDEQTEHGGREGAVYPRSQS